MNRHRWGVLRSERLISDLVALLIQVAGSYLASGHGFNMSAAEYGVLLGFKPNTALIKLRIFIAPLTAMLTRLRCGSHIDRTHSLELERLNLLRCLAEATDAAVLLEQRLRSLIRR